MSCPTALRLAQNGHLQNATPQQNYVYSESVIVCAHPGLSAGKSNRYRFGTSTRAGLERRDLRKMGTCKMLRRNKIMFILNLFLYVRTQGCQQGSRTGIDLALPHELS